MTGGGKKGIGTRGWGAWGRGQGVKDRGRIRRHVVADHGLDGRRNGDRGQETGDRGQG